MKHKFKIVTVVLGIVVAILLIIGYVQLLKAKKWYNKYKAIAETELFSIPLDLSDDGKYTASFEYSSIVHLGVILQLQSGDELLKSDDFNGLAGSVSFIDDKGNTTEPDDFNRNDWKWADKWYLRSGRWLWGDSKYTIFLEIDSRDDYSAGIKPTIVGKYATCECMLIPTMILGVTGIACFVIAGLIVVITFTVLKRRKRQVAEDVSGN
jgi:predicted membrane protein